MTNVLYLSYTGMLEPLGRSQVINYLIKLGPDYRFTLISFEKPENLKNASEMASLREELLRFNIHWIPLRYHHRPRLLASGWDMGQFFFVALWQVFFQRARLIHARGYIASFVALAVSRLSRRSFIFDMRAFWPEELIAAKRLRRGSLVHRVIKGLESRCLDHAAGVISLTQAAVDHMKVTRPDQYFTVIPTCADLDRFTNTEDYPQPPVIGCLGTVTSGWFRLSWLAGFFQAVAAENPHARFEVLTRNDPPQVRAALVGKGLPQQALTIGAVTANEVAPALNKHSASAMFFTSGIAKMASCPTRMGEVLGCGRPVVANEGVGDVAEMIRAFNVGVIVESDSPEDMSTAAKALLLLLQDNELPSRCRAAAEHYFSLEAGGKRYRQVYQTILK
jgi:glycosyltransferase involved in cell wall biosynthesis